MARRDLPCEKGDLPPLFSNSYSLLTRLRFTTKVQCSKANSITFTVRVLQNAERTSFSIRRWQACQPSHINFCCVNFPPLPISCLTLSAPLTLHFLCLTKQCPSQKEKCSCLHQRKMLGMRKKRQDGNENPKNTHTFYNSWTANSCCSDGKRPAELQRA